MSTDLATKLADTKAARDADAPEGAIIFDLIKAQQPGFARALPRGTALTPERFLRVALTEVRRTPALLKCSSPSLLGALMLAAQLGLEPGPLGHAYLVPFWSKKTGTYECTFIPGYRGLIDLARRGGNVDTIYAEAVFEGDDFSWSLGLHRDITHIPKADDRTDPTKISHVYAVAHLRDTDMPQFAVMTRAEVIKIRNRSQAKDSGPWVTDWEQMALKTVTRRLAKWLPLSVEAASVVNADEVTPQSIDINIDDLAAAAATIEAEAREVETSKEGGGDDGSTTEDDASAEKSSDDAAAPVDAGDGADSHDAGGPEPEPTPVAQQDVEPASGSTSTTGQQTLGPDPEPQPKSTRRR